MTSSPLPPLSPAATPRDAWRAGFWRLFLGPPQSRQQHLGGLDGLRGLAVLIVIASHLAHAGLDLVPGLRLIGIGKSGVYLFFVLSAFLLTRTLLQRTPAGFADARLWANYALRRVLRIWPLYLVVLLLSWALTLAGVDAWHYRIDSTALLRHLGLQEGQSVLWSIPVEFKFYLWLPLLALVLAWVGQRRWPLLAEAALAALALALALWIWPPADTGRNDVRLGPYLVLFLCGAFAARLDQWLAGRPRHPRAWGLAGLVALLACVPTLPQVWATLTATVPDNRLSHHWFLFFGLVWSCLLLAILHGPSWLRLPFAWAPMRLVGIVSFSAYLWHMPVLEGLLALGVKGGPLPAWGALMVILLAAMASFLALERPWREVRLPPARIIVDERAVG